MQYTIRTVALASVLAGIVWMPNASGWTGDPGVTFWGMSISILAMVYGAGKVLRKKEYTISLTYTDLLVVSAGFLLIANVHFVAKSGLQTEYLQTIFTAGIFYLLGRNVQEKDFPFLLASIYIVTAWLTCMGLWQLIAGSLNNADHETIPLLVKGSFSNSGIYGIVLSIHFSILYYWRRARDHHLENSYLQAINNILLPIISVLIIVTFSRTAILCVAAAIAIIEGKRQWKNIRMTPLYIKGFVILLMLFMLTSLYMFKAPSASGRFLIWKITLFYGDMQFPFGIGLDQFAIRFPNWQTHYFASVNRSDSEKFLAGNSFFAFNEFLQLFIESGIPGVVTFSLLVIRLLRNKSGKVARMAIISILIACNFSYPLHIPYILSIFLLAAGIIASNENKLFLFRIHYPVARQLFSTVIFSGGFLFLIFQMKQYKTLSRWRFAHDHIRSSEPEALHIYASLSKELNTKGTFLYNYGAELYETRHYEQSIQQLQAARPYFNHIDLYLYLGKAYEATGRLQQAERSFLYASNMIPHRFYPKYFLHQIYIKQKRFDKARETALEIVNMPIKVESQVIKNLKDKMSNYLYKR